MFSASFQCYCYYYLLVTGCVLQGESASSNVKDTVHVGHITHSVPLVTKESFKEKNKGWNFLHSAAQGGDVAIIETMLSLGLDTDSRGSDGTTPLMVAAASGKEQAVAFLLSKGAEPSLINNIGRNLLHAAAEGGNTSIVETVLSYGIDIDSRDNEQVTSLIIAASENHKEVVEYLLEMGADPSLKTSKGNNVLSVAANCGSVATIKRLLSRGLSIDSRDGEGNTPLMGAAACGKTEAVNYLLEQGANPLLKGQKNKWSLVHFAAQSGNVAIIKTMLSKGLNIDSKDNELNVTPLVVSITFDRLEATKYLLDSGANSSIQSSNGLNSLHWASIHGNTAIIDVILSHELDVNVKDRDGCTPIMFGIVATNNMETVDFVLRKGADPFLRDNSGKTLLHHASHRGDVMIIEKCLSLGLDIESKDGNGQTPLMIAAADGNVDVVEYLVKIGASA